MYKSSPNDKGGAEDFVGSSDTKEEVEKIIKENFLKLTSNGFELDVIFVSFIDLKTEKPILDYDNQGYTINWYDTDTIDDEKLSNILHRIEYLITDRKE